MMLLSGNEQASRPTLATRALGLVAARANLAWSGLDAVDRFLLWLCLAPVLLAAAYVVGLRYNASPSVPRGVYWTRGYEASEVHRGTYVCLRSSLDAAPRLLQEGANGKPLPVLLKQVAGLPGDLVEYSDRDANVLVNGEALPSSTWRAHGAHGQVLPHPQYPARLASRQVWLASSHLEGLDSRYFGAVEMAALDCIAEPLWTF